MNVYYRILEVIRNFNNLVVYLWSINLVVVYYVFKILEGVFFVLLYDFKSNIIRKVILIYFIDEVREV